MYISKELSIIILILALIILLIKDTLFPKVSKPKLTLIKKTTSNVTKSINNGDIHINYFPYKPKPNILTDYELRFYSVLKYTLINTNYIICPKVRLSDLLVVYDTNEHLKYFDCISKKSIDFLLCDKDTFEPELAIILDDTNMDLDNPFFKHDELTLIFKASAFKLVRFKKFITYNITDIKEKLNIKELSS